MSSTTFNLFISNSQIAIFWSSFQQPFNLWTQQHVDQGFAWRHGSVSFRTLVESGTHTVELIISDHAGAISTDAVRAIEVPFEVPSEGMIEVASISEAVSVSLPVGNYSLRCELLASGEDGLAIIRLVFAKADVPHFAVLRADDELAIGQELLTSAEAAES